MKVFLKKTCLTNNLSHMRNVYLHPCPDNSVQFANIKKYMVIYAKNTATNSDGYAALTISHIISFKTETIIIQPLLPTDCLLS